MTPSNSGSDAPSIHPLAVVDDPSALGPGCVIHPFAVVAEGVVLGPGVEVFPGTVIGKVPKGAGALAHEPTFERRTTIGANCSIGPNAVVYYGVEIGENCLLGDGASIREGCRVGSRVVLSRCVSVNYETIIGDDTKVMDLTHLTGRMTIGDRVFIGPGVMTANDNAVGKEGFADHILGATIEDEAAIGLGVGILPALTIGRGATVGAKALVTKDVPAGATVMGIPARVVG